jgi:hypothetical protein
MKGQDYLQSASRIEKSEGLDPWTALMRVLVTRLQGAHLPVQLQPVLALAEHHWFQSPIDLTNAKFEVWQYVEGIQLQGADLATPEGRTARALLCVLEPTGDVEARSMTAEWFAAMVDDGLGGE